MNNTFTKQYTVLLTTNLTFEEIIITNLVISYYQNNQDFFYTNNQLLTMYKNQIKNETKLKRIISGIEKKGYIQRVTTKEHYKENNKWGNRRIITPTEKLLNLINNTPTKKEKEVVNNKKQKEKEMEQKNIAQLLKEKEEKLNQSKIHQTNEDKIEKEEELPTPQINDYKEEIEVAEELPTNDDKTTTEVEYINDMGINNETKEFEEDEVYKNQINGLIKEKQPDLDIDTIDEGTIFHFTFDSTLVPFFLRYRKNLKDNEC